MDVLKDMALIQTRKYDSHLFCLSVSGLSSTGENLKKARNYYFRNTGDLALTCSSEAFQCIWTLHLAVLFGAAEAYIHLLHRVCAWRHGKLNEFPRLIHVEHWSKFSLCNWHWVGFWIPTRLFSSASFACNKVSRLTTTRSRPNQTPLVMILMRFCQDILDSSCWGLRHCSFSEYVVWSLLKLFSRRSGEHERFFHGVIVMAEFTVSGELNCRTMYSEEEKHLMILRSTRLPFQGSCDVQQFWAGISLSNEIGYSTRLSVSTTAVGSHIAFVRSSSWSKGCPRSSGWVITDFVTCSRSCVLIGCS